MLSSLKPPMLWRIFSEICAIPRPSFHEEKIIMYIIAFAKKYNIPFEQDGVGNILLRKRASRGMEQRPSIALQAHLDMVTQKNEATVHNFFSDPINPYIDDGWVKASGTTLGADNGIGLASILAILMDDSVEYGALECLLTVSEETGMRGAFGLQSGWLQSKYLINTDSENEGEIFIGCAGGADFEQSMLITRTARPKHHNMVRKIFIKGLIGGHSGCDIDKNRANAIKQLACFLAEFMCDFDFRIVNLQGGDLRNAICREAFIVITFNSTHYNKLLSLISSYRQILKNKYFYTDPNIIFDETSIDQQQIVDVISYSHQAMIVDWLNTVPNGVVSMCGQHEDIVESSINLAVVGIEDNYVVAKFLVRYLTESAKNSIVSTLISLSRLAKLDYNIGHSYPHWEPRIDSPLLNLVQHKYQALFLTPAKVMVVHAGLECGLFKSVYPDIDIVSIGPTIVSPHSPHEKVNIDSVLRYWNLLLSIIQSADELE